MWRPKLIGMYLYKLIKIFTVKSLSCDFDDSAVCGYYMSDAWKRKEHNNRMGGKLDIGFMQIIRLSKYREY